jgi:GTP pyrophosphokinase
MAAERVWALHAQRSPQGGSEGLRRLLLAIIRDVRVVFILLSRQLARMRAAASLPDEERQELARLTRDIHAPLANRLGIWQLKWELEDLAFRYLQPDTYKRIAKLLDERRRDRETFIREALAELGEALRAGGIKADLAGRPKHIYSIWKRCSARRWNFPISTTSAPCASWWTAWPIATRRSVSCMPCGRTCPASSMTTWRGRRATVIARCIPR